MKLEQSAYLASCRSQLKQLISLLERDYEYVSVLATDVSGTAYSASQRSQSIRPYGFGERGFVVRLYGDGGYQEYSFNQLDDIDQLAERIRRQLNSQNGLLGSLSVSKYETPLVHEENIEKQFAGEIADSIPAIDPAELMKKLKDISDQGAAREHVVECAVSFTHVVISKMFLSSRRDLMQSYGFVTCSLVMLAAKDGQSEVSRVSDSGWKGTEIIDEVAARMDECYQDVMCLFGAENVKPGEYTVICPPESSGIIAHEAFGHGLEMDMFVKDRAVAKYHMQEKIASDVTDMYDGATNIRDTASFFFDDEGTLAGETQILKNGYLVAGMSDLLSALRLGVKPSANGRRETYRRKAYTRMTNTYFGKGDSTLEEMIASTDYGFIIDGAQSGMEDPKNWGIQCVLSRAREIRDGKLTGKIYSPVILTGYVPDLLANISMVSGDVCTNGNGYCGKGYKEWVVVSDGGPYIKTKVRLG
ncbi:MAG: TldD/PmbA family protein [Erysipelotrichaceae bacterium]|nr:TldD/PmbA family protein [Erysipelotrichaceae bacterium]